MENNNYSIVGGTPPLQSSQPFVDEDNLSCETAPDIYICGSSEEPSEDLHNSLNGLQGGNTYERFHLTRDQWLDLTTRDSAPLNLIAGNNISIGGTYPNLTIASLIDLTPYYTKLEANATFKPISYVPSWSEVTNKPQFFDGNYNSLINKPILFSGSYNDLTNKPTIPSIAGLATEVYVNSQGFIKSVSWQDVNNKPSFFSGNYNDLINKPTLFSGDYNDLINKPVTGNLQAITQAGNSTDRGLLVTGSAGINASTPGFAIYQQGVGGGLSTITTDGIGASVLIGDGGVIIDAKLSTESTSTSYSFRTDSESAGFLVGARIQMNPAINNNEAAQLGQVPKLVAGNGVTIEYNEQNRDVIVSSTATGGNQSLQEVTEQGNSTTETIRLIGRSGNQSELDLSAPGLQTMIIPDLNLMIQTFNSSTGVNRSLVQSGPGQYAIAVSTPNPDTGRNSTFTILTDQTDNAASFQFSGRVNLQDGGINLSDVPVMAQLPILLEGDNVTITEQTVDFQSEFGLVKQKQYTISAIGGTTPDIPTLQQVTDQDNITDNAIHIRGLGGIDLSTPGGLLYYANGTFGLNHIPLNEGEGVSRMNFFHDRIYITIDTDNGADGSFELRNTVLFGGLGAVLKGRLRLGDAVNNDEAVTLGQLNSAIPAPNIIDAVPTDNSNNAVSSNGVFDALAGKVNTNNAILTTTDQIKMGNLRFNNTHRYGSNNTPFDIIVDTAGSVKLDWYRYDGNSKTVTSLQAAYAADIPDEQFFANTVYLPTADGHIALREEFIAGSNITITKGSYNGITISADIPAIDTTQFIQNQNAAVQTAAMRISGNVQSAGTLIGASMTMNATNLSSSSNPHVVTRSTGGQLQTRTLAQFSSDLQVPVLEGALVSNPDWTGNTQKAPLTGGRTDVKKTTTKRVLAAFGVKANLNSPPATVTDVTTTDAMYGTTAIQVNLATNTEVQLAPSAALTTGVNVTDGMVRLWFKPIANVGSGLNKFSIELHSAGTPAAVTANFHQLNAFGAPSDLNQRLTSTAGTGRWQSYSVAVPNMIVAGTGADLTNIKFARLILRSPNANLVIQVGNIEFIPNQLTKAKCILSFDDGFLSQLTYAAAQMSKYGFAGVLFPSPITTTIGVDADRLTPTQIKNMHDNLGWQIASQAWSTESNTVIDAMTEDQFTSELSRIRNWQKSLGVTGGEHGSYFSNVGPQDMIAYPTFRKHFRSMRTYFEGTAATPPMQIGETFPYGDSMAVRAMNGATSSWGTNTGSQLISHVDQAIANKGVAYFAWHNDLAAAGNARTGFDALLAYLDANRDKIDVVLEEDLYKTSTDITSLNNAVKQDAVLTKTAAYTILVTDFGKNGNLTVYADATAGNVAITLPTAATMASTSLTYTVNVIKTDSSTNSVVVMGASSVLINAANTDTLSTQYSAGSYKSNGTKYFKF